MQYLAVNSLTRDYLIINGSPVRTNDVATASYYCLSIPANNWLYAVDGQGSLLYTLLNEKRTATVEAQFASYVDACIQTNLIDTGKATAAQIQNLQATSTGTLGQLSVTPKATPPSLAFKGLF